jgi:hypothetical protein
MEIITACSLNPTNTANKLHELLRYAALKHAAHLGATAL